MRTGPVSDINVRLPELGEAGEIHSLADALPVAKSRPSLLPAEEEASLPAPDYAPDPTLQTLKQMLGARLSSDNLAWRGDPVPVMRSLQKMLVGHSLSLAEGQRDGAMRAIRVVELAVRWRLRWMQMRRSEAQSHFLPSEQEEHATQTNN